MFALNNVQTQLLSQLSQVSTGLISAVSNPGIRSKTSKTASISKLKFHPLSSSSNCKDKSDSVLITADQPSNYIHSTNNNHLANKEKEVALLSSKIAQQISAKILEISSSSSSIISEISGYLNNSNRNSSSLHASAALSKLWQNIELAVKESSTLHFCPIGRKAVLSSLEERLLNKNSKLSSLYYSFSSTGSFDIDRRVGPLLHNYHLRSAHPLILNVPTRGFKTNRGNSADEARNPGLFTRIKNKLFPPYPTTTTTNTNLPPGSFGHGNTNPQQQERLKALIAQLPPDEASKIKVAFAEGYIAANPTTAQSSSRTYRWLRTLQQVLAIAVFTAILFSLMGSVGGGMFRVNVGNGNEVQPEDISVSFNDVKGVDEAKAELMEVVEFLRSPEKFVQLGGKLPKGVLLVGPPGTGKTLLARAVAGEAGVPFFHAAGPEFDEILVGQGARRVRDLFKAAKAKAPCVIFIDEIDSVGAKRTNSVLHPYANQTINQLLSEMDGFRQNEGVIVLGATNRREDLDRALLRPGRFDVEVSVPAPELKGRREILEYYLGRVKRGEDVEVEVLARGTTGFTGADLENMVNQAALRAAIEGADRVLRKHLDFARDKVIMGPERKSKIPDEETNRITAYHEGGHAIVAHYTKDAHPLHKVTIIPRGSSLGHTAYIPEKERYHVTRSQLSAMMDTMMGGRAAEELIFGTDKITSGASSDLKQATAIATHMVKEWGMSEKVGLRAIEERQMGTGGSELGPQTHELIDTEIKRILSESYERAKSILKLHSKEHVALAEALIKYETLDAEDVKALFAGEPRKEVKERKNNTTLGNTGEIGTSGPIGTQIGGFGLGGKRPSPCP